MPNTPATIQEGVTVWTPNGGEKWGDIFDERELKLCSKVRSDEERSDGWRRQ